MKDNIVLRKGLSVDDMSMDALFGGTSQDFCLGHSCGCNGGTGRYNCTNYSSGCTLKLFESPDTPADIVTLMF